MSYLHCHNCDWSQDDFWNYNFKRKKDWKRFLTFKWSHRPFGYNPESVLLEDIGIYLKPRRIGMDSQWMIENGFKEEEKTVHSWWFLKDGLKRYFRIKKNMVYKTHNDYKKAKENGTLSCPKCGTTTELDID